MDCGGGAGGAGGGGGEEEVKIDGSNGEGEDGEGGAGEGGCKGEATAKEMLDKKLKVDRSIISIVIQRLYTDNHLNRLHLTQLRKPRHTHTHKHELSRTQTL